MPASASVPRVRYAVEPLATGRAAVARSILEALPEWFGRPDALRAYVRAADALPMLVAKRDAGPAGFLCIERHTEVAAEIHVMGVLREHHRRGCGRALIATAAGALAADGLRWLTVKTLGAAHPDPHYAATRRFYEAVGFEPLEVFTTLWDAETPCLYMVKPLATARSGTAAPLRSRPRPRPGRRRAPHEA